MSGRGMIAKKKVQTKSTKAGLIFPVARFHRYLKQQFASTRQFKISAGAAVYTASVLEYLVAEVAEQAGNASKVMKLKRITPRHIMLAIHQDLEMKQALNHVTIPGCGRPLNLLLPNKPSNKKPKKSCACVTTKQKVTTKTKPQKKVLKKTIPVKKTIKKATTKKMKKSAKKSLKKTSSTKSQVEHLNQRMFSNGQMLYVVKGDITNVKVDAAVHPTSGCYHFGGQVGSAMKRKGGSELEKEVDKTRRTNPSLANCGAIISGAANLPYSRIIHVNSPSWASTLATSISNLEKAVLNILNVADESNVKTLAMPSISSGGGGYSKQVAAETILRTINNYFNGTLNSKIREITFVIYDQETLDVYNAELKRLA